MVNGNDIQMATKRCIPVSLCSEIQWLNQHRSSSHSLDLSQIQCGYRKVWCNIADTIEDPAIYNTIDGVGGRSCFGHLKIYFYGSNGRLNMAKLMSGRLYGKMSRISNVYRVSVHGNCCWNLHKYSHFRGEMFGLSVGFDRSFTRRINSAKPTNC